MAVTYCTQTPLGWLELAEEQNAIVRLSFVEQPDCKAPPSTPLLEECAHQLDEYFAGVRRSFDLPLAPKGTPFQQRIWQALQEIPYGETRTYKQIAVAAGCPKGCRAVGMANNRNPIAILIPCHRVIGANGKLVGYAGGTDIKRRLLELEGAVFSL